MPSPSTAARPRRRASSNEAAWARRRRRCRSPARLPARRSSRAAARGCRPCPSEVVLTMVAAVRGRTPPPASRRRRRAAPKCAPQRLGAGPRAVGDAHLRHAVGEQRLDDRARARPLRRAPAPARAAGDPARRALAQVGDEAVAVGIVGVDRAVRRRSACWPRRSPRARRDRRRPAPAPPPCAGSSR